MIMRSLLLAVSAAATATWAPASIQDLHREYHNIFKFGNRNAASHLWSSFILDRAEDLSPALFETMFTGFCAVSGSPTRPGDYTRYRLTLPMASGGGTGASGYLYYCCWPCVCDTQDFIRVDTKNVTLAGGETRRYHFAVVGNPCDDTSALRVPFVQPFDRRSTTLEREAPEVRCADGVLQGATLSDHGFPIISMFFGATELTTLPADHPSLLSAGATDGDGTALAVAPPPSDDPTFSAVVAAAARPPQPGRISRAKDGTLYQDEAEYAAMCKERAANGYNSGMGEIFRRVAAIAPVPIARAVAGRQLEQDVGSVSTGSVNGNDSSNSSTSSTSSSLKEMELEWSATPRPPPPTPTDGGSCGAPPPPVD